MRVWRKYQNGTRLLISQWRLGTQVRCSLNICKVMGAGLQGLAIPRHIGYIRGSWRPKIVIDDLATFRLHLRVVIIIEVSTGRWPKPDVHDVFPAPAITSSAWSKRKHGLRDLHLLPRWGRH